MKLLLDTHYVIEVVGDREEGLGEPGLLDDLQSGNVFVASVVSLWEADIKRRMGKLRLTYGPKAWPPLLASLDIELVVLETKHIFADIGMEPGHKDPFDRALLSTAAAEDCRLLTRDRLLQSHPLAWRPFLR